MIQIPNLKPNQAEKIAITRIDIAKTNTGIVVNKYADGWTASTPPISSAARDDWTLDGTIDWLKSNGWTVRAWHYGARAWKGEMLPVRDRSAILRKRCLLLAYPDPRLQLTQLDLAYDL